MKIISNRHKIFPKEVECENCDSTILLESQEDVEVMEEESPFDMYIKFKWICPCCYAPNYIIKRFVES